MRLNTLYLRRMLSVNGHHSLAGRRLYDRFREMSDDCLLGHVVQPNEVASRFKDPRMQDDIVSFDLLQRLDPNILYLEGGLFYDDTGSWKIPQSLAERLVSEGATLIVADADINELTQQKLYYRQAQGFFQLSIDYGRHDDSVPVYGYDDTAGWKGGGRQIVCSPDKMVISEWLRPIYEGITEVMASLPVELSSWQHILASGNQGTTRTLQHDLDVDRYDCCAFAAVANLGLGHAVFIAANVSSDVWLERCPDNVTWLVNVARFLAEKSAQDRARQASHHRSPFLVFLSHRSVDNHVVAPVAARIRSRGIGIWLDQDVLVPSDSLVDEISAGLERMTHFVLFWSAACVGAPWVEKELRAATMRLVESHTPMIIVRMDDTPVPAILADVYRIEGGEMTSGQIGDSVADAIERLAKRHNPL